MRSVCFFIAALLPACFSVRAQQAVTIGNSKISLLLEYGDKACISSLLLNGQKIVSGADGAYTSVRVGSVEYSSLHLLSAPSMVRGKDGVQLDGIVYGDRSLQIRERWVVSMSGEAVKWRIERSFSRGVKVDESALPVIHFDKMDTWEGAYQGYGGLAWFYLFNEPLCTYGVHSRLSSFWNSKTGNGLDILAEAPGRQVAMKYTRTKEDRLAYAVTVSDQPMLPRYDSGTHRRRFIRGGTDVWGAYDEAAGSRSATISFRYFDEHERYGRGKMVGLDGEKVSAVLGTIARIGVIDSLHFGGNSWHTPYGPICLHEQYIAQMGLGIDDEHYLKGYQSCLDFYRDHAIKPDGRVFARWAYSDEDMMKGQGNKYGFYEAQWGYLMDANPDFVTNVSELFDLTGDMQWVRRHQAGCEKALEWILKRDENRNGLVEMMTKSEKEARGSDWIDIIWASYENAFVNAKLYHALVKWAAIERLLGNFSKASYYEDFALKLKTSFNKPTSQGGFWDEEKQCYAYWLNKDRSVHGRNMVTPVNFMAIAYGICDDAGRAQSILDGLEAQMVKEKLFFWPLCMTSYAPGEGRETQYPFPSYENGDLFLSWGAVAVRAYAGYRPELAVKYVKNVLEQYGKDGLAFQRYGREKQDGQGDDILSGNSLSIVGLYQAIYGVNPLYNRLLLDPHITPELAGTELIYRWRGRRLLIGLDAGSYSVTDDGYRIMSTEKFGFNRAGDSVSYFHGDSVAVSMTAVAKGGVAIAVKSWERDQREWGVSGSEGVVRYVVRQLRPGTTYSYSLDGKALRSVRSDAHGVVVFQCKGNGRVKLTKKNLL